MPDHAFEAKALIPRWMALVGAGLALVGVLLVWLLDGLVLLQGELPDAGDVLPILLGLFLVFFGGAAIVITFQPPRPIPVVVSDHGLVVHEAKHLTKVHDWKAFDGGVSREPTPHGTTLVFTLRTTFRGKDGQLHQELVRLEGVEDADRAEREILARVAHAQANVPVPG